eukprot:scaffold109018_cov99-Phaeocystis_antarctica.AAC.2
MPAAARSAAMEVGAMVAVIAAAAAKVIAAAAAAKGSAEVREPMQSHRQSPSLRHPDPRGRCAQLDSERCRHCQSFGR